MASHPGPPHFPRLLRRIEEMPEPLVELWGWPGSGKRALCQTLVRLRRDCLQLPVVGLTDANHLREAVAAAGAGWILCEITAGLGPGDLAEILRPDQRLLFITRRHRPVGDLPVGLIGPGELLLRESEVEELWRQVGAEKLSEHDRDELRSACEGWYRPLRLAAEAAVAGDAEAVKYPELVPAVAALLRHEVMRPMAASQQDLLLEISLTDFVDPAAWRELWLDEAERWHWLDRLEVEEGLILAHRPGQRRLPLLLRRFLAQERRRLWTREKVATAERRLGLTYYALGRPVEALARLLAAGDTPRVERLLELDWIRLFAEAPSGLLETALASLRLRSDQPLAVRFLARLLEDLAQPASTGAGLRDLSRQDSEDPVLPGVVDLAAAALDLASGSPAQTEPAAGWIESGQLPEAVRTLARWVRDCDQPERAREAVAAVCGADGESPQRVAEEEAADAPIAVRLIWTLASRAQASSAAAAEGDASPTHAPAAPASRSEETASARLQAPALTCRVVLLGNPRALMRAAGHDFREVRWRLRRAFKILLYLASSPDLRAAKDELLEAVWPGVDQEKVRRNFHPTLSSLRRTLQWKQGGTGTAVLFRNGFYLLSPELAWDVDVVEFSRRIESGREQLRRGEGEKAAENLRAAWRLYGGPYLQGFYESWAEARREEYQSLYQDLLRDLGNLYVELRRPTEAEDAYRSLLAVDPLQEGVHLAIMKLYAVRGRRDLARRQFARLSALLRQELGVEPLPETTAEYHRLMA